MRSTRPAPSTASPSRAAPTSSTVRCRAASLTLTKRGPTPIVVTITGDANHAAAVAYIDQAGGIPQFSNERSADAAVQALRRLIVVKPDASFRLDQSAATVRTKAGTMIEARIEHATGTVSNPLSDQQLREKFLGNAETGDRRGAGAQCGGYDREIGHACRYRRAGAGEWLMLHGGSDPPLRARVRKSIFDKLGMRGCGYGVQGGRFVSGPILPNWARMRSMSAFSSASVA